VIGGLNVDASVGKGGKWGGGGGGDNKGPVRRENFFINLGKLKFK